MIYLMKIRGEGLSCGEGSTNSYYSYSNQGYVSIGFGQGYRGQVLDMNMNMMIN